MKRYYLLRYDFEASLGGYMDDLSIVDVSCDRNVLVERVRKDLKDVYITHINDCEIDEFEFDESENQWFVAYELGGLCVRNDSVYKIVERED